MATIGIRGRQVGNRLLCANPGHRRGNVGASERTLAFCSEEPALKLSRIFYTYGEQSSLNTIKAAQMEMNLARLLTEAARHPINVLEQRRSFAFGTYSVDDDAVSGATIADMTALDPNGSLKSAAGARETYAAARSPQTPLAGSALGSASGLIKQYDFITDVIRRSVSVSSGNFTLKPELIKQLHAFALPDEEASSGQYRQYAVLISGSNHAPPQPESIAAEVIELCRYFNDNRFDLSATKLAAYALWDLNRIHPFQDGNGRTARALCYLIIGIVLKGVIPGTPTIVEQLAADRQAYFLALQAADIAFGSTGTINVTKLEHLLEGMLLKQLRGEPTLSENSSAKLRHVLDERFFSAPTTLQSRIAASEDPQFHLWANGEHLILQIGDRSEIDAADNRRARYGNPFPHLLSAEGGESLISVDYGRRNALLTNQMYDVGEGNVLSLSRDAAAVVRAINIRFLQSASGMSAWEIAGTLYILRLGFYTNINGLPKSFDMMLSRDTLVAGV